MPKKFLHFSLSLCIVLSLSVTSAYSNESNANSSDTIEQSQGETTIEVDATVDTREDSEVLEDTSQDAPSESTPVSETSDESRDTSRDSTSDDQSNESTSITTENPVTLDFNEFPTTLNVVETADGIEFIMTVTNNSGKDITADSLPVFARVFVYHIETDTWYYLREKEFNLDPKLFASGQTITETFNIRADGTTNIFNETTWTNIPTGNYWFYSVPSIVINNYYTQLMIVGSEFTIGE